MEQNTPKFRLRLNLFDAIVLVLALAVGAFLLWNALKPEPTMAEPTKAASVIRYTVLLNRWAEGDSALIHKGDQLTEVGTSCEVGQIVDIQVLPATSMTLDRENRAWVLADVPGCEDILITVEGLGTIEERGALLGGGYTIRAGLGVSIRGGNYVSSGTVVSIQREGEA